MGENGQPSEVASGLWGPLDGSAQPVAEPAPVDQGLDPVRPEPMASLRRDRRPLLAGVGAIVLLTIAALIGVLLRPSGASRQASPSRGGAGSNLDAVQSAGAAAPSGAWSATDGPSSDGATSGPDHRAIASQIDILLSQSQQARSGIGPAIDRVMNCTASAAEVTQFQDAAAVRTRISASLDTIDFAALPSGKRIQTMLGQLSSASAAADQSYASWAQDQLGCIGQAATDDPAYVQANADSAVATKTKTGFVALWNPIARSLQLPVRQPGKI